MKASFVMRKPSRVERGGVMHKGWKDAPIWPRGTKKGGEICTVPLSTGSKVAPSIAGCTNSHNAIFVVWRAQWLSVHSNFPDYHRAQFENSGTKCFSHARAYNAWWIGEGSVSWQVPFNFFPSPNCGVLTALPRSSQREGKREGPWLIRLIHSRTSRLKAGVYEACYAAIMHALNRELPIYCVRQVSFEDNYAAVTLT